MKKMAVLLVAAVTAIGGVLPAHAFPTAGAPKVEASQQVEKIQWRGERWRHGPYVDGRPRYYRHGRHYRHHGRYYRDYGRYHRRHHGSHAGAIIGGLAAGAIIGGALAQPRYAPSYRYAGASSHTRWCYDRYRSYRAYDNTFQPYHGPRQQCYSPYR